MTDVDSPRVQESAAATREVSVAREHVSVASSQIYDLMELDAKVTEPGPGVALCEGKDSDKFYEIHHPWSRYSAPFNALREAFERLRVGLSKHGWSIARYGKDRSPAQNLEILAESSKNNISALISLRDRRGDKEGSHYGGDNNSIIYVIVLSACLQVPEGQTVDKY